MGIWGFGGEHALLKEPKEERRKGIFDSRKRLPWGIRYEVGAVRRNALKLFRISVKSENRHLHGKYFAPLRVDRAFEMFDFGPSAVSCHSESFRNPFPDRSFSPFILGGSRPIQSKSRAVEEDGMVGRGSCRLRFCIDNQDWLFRRQWLALFRGRLTTPLYFYPLAAPCSPDSGRNSPEISSPKRLRLRSAWRQAGRRN